VLSLEDSYTNVESRYFKISCLFPFSHVMWTYLLRKFNRQQKSIYHPRENFRIISDVKRGVSCRELFKKFNILTVMVEFLLTFLSFIVDNMEKIQTN
jgi:hypothetical protein